MSQAVDHDDAKDPPSQLADYYRWVEPDRGIRIYINFETAERLQIQVLRGLDSNVGVEVGGFLLGRAELDEGRITAVIDDFEPVPCAYSNGPLYSAKSADAARFEAALAKYKSETASGLSIIGYYRSHKRDNLYLSADDLTLIQRVFSGTDNVFLLIKPLSPRACTGGFFFWEDGNIQSEFTLEVPFAPVRPPSPTPSGMDGIDDLLLPDRLDLSEDLTTIPPSLSREPGLSRHDRSADQTVAQVFARGSAKTPVDSVNLTLHIDEVAAGGQRLSSAQQPDELSGIPAFLPAPPLLAERAPDLPANGRSSRIWVVVALMLFLVGSAWYGMGIRLPIAPAPRPDRIGLRIERTGRDVQITWDSASAVLRGATLGLFRIRDGEGKKEIRVSPEELKQGRLLYIPASNDVDIHMQVFTPDNRKMEESVRIIDGSVSDRPEPSETQFPVKGMIPGTLEKLFSAKPAVKPPQISQQSLPESSAVKSPKPFIPPVVQAVPDQIEAVASNLTPPQLSPQASQHGTNVPLPHHEALRVQPPPPAPSSPPAEQLSPLVVTPPTPRRQATMILPEHLRRLISKDITLDIHCTVGADGQVTIVKTPRVKTSLEGQLSALAAATARKWLFTPARLHGQPVSSDYVITFSFHRSNR